MADVLLKKKIYKEQMDKMLLQYVFPEFNSHHGHMRARVSKMINMKLCNDQNYDMIDTTVLIIFSGLLGDALFFGN